jgi:hypothetical protein
MDWQVNLTGNVPEAAAAGAAALREEDAAAKSALAGLEAFRGAASAIEASTRATSALASELRAASAAASAARPAFSAATPEDFKRSKWEAPLPPAPPSASALGASSGGAGSALAKGATSAASALGSTASALKTATVGLVAYGAAMAGLHGLSDLTTMAIGWRTMGQLQLLSYRATMDLRRAVLGVDAQPLVRTFARLETNLSKSTVTGSALSGILTRGFSGAFAMFERFGPMVEGAFQGAVLGALKVEIAWVKLKTAAVPLVAAYESLVGPADEANASATAGGAAFSVLAGGLRLAADAASALVSAYNGLAAKGAFGAGAQGREFARFNQEQAEERSAAASRANGKSQVYEAEDGGAFKRNRGQEILNQQEAGKANGKALADGHVEGIDAGAAAVGAAGERLGATAIAGARRGADAHSPSRKAIVLGKDIDAGAAQGVDEDAPKVEAAGARMAASAIHGAGKGGAPGGAGAGLTVGQIGPFYIQASAGSTEDQRRQILGYAPDLAQEILRILSARLGLPVLGTS